MTSAPSRPRTGVRRNRVTGPRSSIHWCVAWVVALAVTATIDVAAAEITSALTGCWALLALRAGIRRYRPVDPLPWRLFGVAAAAFLLGGVVAEVVPPTVPCAACVIDGLGYIAMITAAVRLVRRRTLGAKVDRAALLDATVIVLALGSVLWAGLLLPWVADSSAGIPARVGTVVFSLLTMLFCAQIARLAFSPGARNPSTRLLAGAAFAVFVVDISAVLVDSGASVGIAGTVMTVCSGVATACCGAAALHPSMRLVSAPAQDAVPELTRRRLVILGVGALTPTVVLWALVPETRTAAIAAVIVAWAASTVFVLARLHDMVRRYERAAEIERVQRQVVADLVAAETVDDALRAGLDAAGALVPPGRSGHAKMLWRPDDEWVIVRGDGSSPPRDADSAALIEGALESRRRGEAVRCGPRADGRWVVVCAMTTSEMRAAVAVVTDEVTDDLVGALAALASTMSLATAAAEVAQARHRRQHERQFRRMIEGSSDLVMVVEDGICTFASPSAERLFRDRTVVGSSLVSLVVPEDRELLCARPGTTTAVRVTTPSGTRWIEGTRSSLSGGQDAEGTASTFVVNARDVTERRQEEQRLAQQEAKFRALVQHSADFIAVVDDAAVLTYVGPNSEALVGVEADRLVGRRVSSLAVSADAQRLEDAVAGAHVTASPMEMRWRVGEHAEATFEVHLTDLRDEPAVGGIVVNARDVTTRARLTEDLRHRALHDSLTNLPNRTLLEQRLASALRLPDPDDPITVVSIDVDDFGGINDTAGRAAGDGVLRQVAAVLDGALEPNETVARIGADEFAMLLRRPSDEACDLIDRLSPLTVKLAADTDRIVSLSAGVASTSPGSALTAEVLLRDAGLAMDRSRTAHDEAVTIFDPSIADDHLARLRLRDDLSAALDGNDQIVVHYQPVVSIDGSAVIGFEALVRWNHPELGTISPGRFLPVAEVSGLMVALGRHVIGRAITDFSERWPEAHGPTVHVNLSVQELVAPGTVEFIADALAATGLAAERLTVELTEEARADRDAHARLEALRALGVHLAADDFGSGYATYAALQRLPFDMVKVDRSLVMGLDGDDPHRARVQLGSIVDMCTSLGLTTVAEGVEDLSGLDALRELGFDQFQGFLVAKPAPLGDVAGLYERATTRPPTPELAIISES